MPAHDDHGFIRLFDGVSLEGWHAVPRRYGQVYPGGPPLAEVLPSLPPGYDEEAQAHPAVWSVVDGAIEGRQDPGHPGFGGYLVSDQAFGDFELELELKPDWPADTGVMVRRLRDNWAGFQVLVDHRKSGSIGGFYGNGIGGFHAVPFVLDVRVDAAGRPDGLVEEDPATTLEPLTADKRAMLGQAGEVGEFLRSWRWQGWNHLRVRCVGDPPVLTTWVNGNLTAELDTATIRHPQYDAGRVAGFLGPSGHLAFEVHDNDPMMGTARWGRDARCRWRDIKIRVLDPVRGSGADPTS